MLGFGCKEIQRSCSTVILLDILKFQELFDNFVFFFNRQTYDGERNETIGESIIQSNAAKFRACDKFTYKCLGCKTDNIIAKPFVRANNSLVPVLQACSNKDCTMTPMQQMVHIRNNLTMAIRNAIRNYYDNWLQCDEPNCNQATRTYVHVRRDFRLILRNVLMEYFLCRWLIHKAAQCA